MPNTKRDKYDEVARQSKQSGDGYGLISQERIAEILRSAFPPLAEDAHACACWIAENCGHKDPKHEGYWIIEIAPIAHAIERFAQSRVEPFRRVLEQYADDKNWRVDESVEGAVARLWMEPGSSTPTAYHGFELAQRALLSDSTAKEKT